VNLKSKTLNMLEEQEVPLNNDDHSQLDLKSI